MNSDNINNLFKILAQTSYGSPEEKLMSLQMANDLLNAMGMTWENLKEQLLFTNRPNPESTDRPPGFEEQINNVGKYNSYGKLQERNGNPQMTGHEIVIRMMK